MEAVGMIGPGGHTPALRQTLGDVGSGRGEGTQGQAAVLDSPMFVSVCVPASVRW